MTIIPRSPACPIAIAIVSVHHVTHDFECHQHQHWRPRADVQWLNSLHATGSVDTCYDTAPLLCILCICGPRSTHSNMQSCWLAFSPDSNLLHFITHRSKPFSNKFVHEHSVNVAKHAEELYHNEVKCGGFYITKKNGTQHACRCSKVWCVNMIIHLHWRGWKHGNQYNYFLDLAIAFNTHLMTHCEIMASESNKFTSEIRMLWSSVLLSQNTSSLHWCPVHTLQGMPQVAATAMHMLYRLRSTMQ